MRSDKHAMWSKNIFKIMAVKKLGYELMYKVNAVWRYPFELQLIEGNVIRLAAGGLPPVMKEVPKNIPPPKIPRAKPSGKMKRGFPKMKRGFPKKAAAPPALRRSTRIRKAPVRFGF